MLLQTMKQLLVEKTITPFLMSEYNLFFWEMISLILVVIQGGDHGRRTQNEHLRINTSIKESILPIKKIAY